MMHLDRNALDGFLKDTGPAPGLPWALAPVLAEAGEVQTPLVAEDHAGEAATVVPLGEGEGEDEEQQSGAEEESRGYELMVIEGAAGTPPPPEEEAGWAEAAPNPSAEGAIAVVAHMAPPAPVQAPATPSMTPVAPRAVGQVEHPTYRSIQGPGESEWAEGTLLPRRRRWSLMVAASAGVALAGAAVLLALPTMRRESFTAATETAPREELSERAPVASASQVSIPDPAPLEGPAAPKALPRSPAEEAMHEMRFPGLFDRNSSHPHDIDAAALGDIVRLLKTRCADGSIVLTGHTCALGDARSNQALSLLRARRVGELLVRTGFSPEQLQLVGQGDRQPIADNRAIEGKRQNRRVTISCDPNPQGHPRQLGANDPGPGPRQPTPEEDAR